MKLVIVTGNANKVAQIERHLQRPIEQIDIDLPEIQAVRVEDVIEAKALVAFRQVRLPVIVEDTGLTFEVWNGQPGALITWFLEGVGNKGICQMLEGFENRRVVAQTCIGLYDGNEFTAFSGFESGVVPIEPRGNMGFGWDASFQPDGSEKTFAEMMPDEVGRGVGVKGLVGEPASPRSCKVRLLCHLRFRCTITNRKYLEIS